MSDGPSNIDTASEGHQRQENIQKSNNLLASWCARKHPDWDGMPPKIIPNCFKSYLDQFIVILLAFMLMSELDYFHVCLSSFAF